MEIRNRLNAAVIFSSEGDVRETLLAAIAAGADLRSADLRYADLHSANLRSSDLRDADLYNACLHNADLRGMTK